MAAIACLKNPNYQPPWSIRTRWLNCLSMLKDFRLVCTHIFREGNMAADSLANLGLQYNTMVWWHAPPMQVRRFIHEDIMGWPKYRFS